MCKLEKYSKCQSRLRCELSYGLKGVRRRGKELRLGNCQKQARDLSIISIYNRDENGGREL